MFAFNFYPNHLKIVSFKKVQSEMTILRIKCTIKKGFKTIWHWFLKLDGFFLKKKDTLYFVVSNTRPTSFFPFIPLAWCKWKFGDQFRFLAWFFFSVSGESLMSRIYSSLSGGELFEKITEEGYTMSEAEVINYMRQVCEGVKHMHERNIIHLGKLIFIASN